MELTAENVKQMINQQTAANNAWSAEQAQKQMDFQREMSNTAHQREVADLKAAGLNPVLAANQGASSAVGASADPDQSGNSALVSFLGNLIQTQNQLELQKNNAELQRELTDKTNALSKLIAEINRATALDTANIHAAASMYASDNLLQGTMYSSDNSSSAARYAADLAAQTAMDQLEYKTDNPTSVGQVIAQGVSGAIKGLTGTSVTNAARQVGNAAGRAATWATSRSNPLSGSSLVNSFLNLFGAGSITGLQYNRYKMAVHDGKRLTAREKSLIRRYESKYKIPKRYSIL